MVVVVTSTGPLLYGKTMSGSTIVAEARSLHKISVVKQQLGNSAPLINRTIHFMLSPNRLVGFHIPNSAQYIRINSVSKAVQCSNFICINQS